MHKTKEGFSPIFCPTEEGDGRTEDFVKDDIVRVKIFAPENGPAEERKLNGTNNFYLRRGEEFTLIQ